MQLSVRHLHFTYEGSYAPVFDDLTVNLDTSWRLALIARNGRGKTTLLRILMGQLPYTGTVDVPLTPVYFPFEPSDRSLLTLYVMQEAAPDVPDWRFLREMNLLRLDEDVLYRPFDTLSKGEQTKALLCALFSREDAYPLIDEPTNHLDVHGRELVARYLKQKDGFLLVSHDRAFLNECVDHVFCLNKADAWVMQGDYDAWEERFNLQNASEQARNDTLKRDIARLAESAHRAAQWADHTEQSKFHVPTSEQAVVDRGYAGARSAAMMKRAKNTVRRRERALEEKSALLHNAEQVGELKLTVLTHPKQVLIEVRDGVVRYGDRVVAKNITFTVSRGERVVLTGENGCGKSSVLKALCGLGGSLEGTVRVAPGMIISYVPQETDGLSGDVRTFLRDCGLDETLFKAILRNMDFGREAFDRDLSTLSQGQKKKILLAASLCTPAHLYVWDEPLNYIDVFSRVQTETLIRTYRPTLLMVEHDRAFAERTELRPVHIVKE